MLKDIYFFIRNRFKDKKESALFFKISNKIFQKIPTTAKAIAIKDDIKDQIHKDINREELLEKLLSVYNYFEDFNKNIPLEERLEYFLLLGDIYHNLGKYNEAYLTLSRVEYIFKSNVNCYISVKIRKYHYLSHYIPLFGVKRLKYLKKYVVRNCTEDIKCALYSYLGDALLKYGNFEVAKQYLEIGELFFKKLKRKDLISKIKSKKARVYMFLGMFEKAYDEIMESIDYTSYSSIFGEKKYYDIEYCSNLFTLSEYYKIIGDLQKADKTCRASIYIARKANYMSLIPYLYLNLLQIYRAKGIKLNYGLIIREIENSIAETDNIFLYRILEIEKAIDMARKGRLREALNYLLNVEKRLKEEKSVKFEYTLNVINNLKENLIILMRSKNKMYLDEILKTVYLIQTC